MLAKSIVLGFYNKSNFNIVHFEKKSFHILMRKRKQKGLRIQISHFYWSFSSGIMAVKEFKMNNLTMLCTLQASLLGTLPPDTPLTGYSTEVAFLISAHLSTDTASPQKVFDTNKIMEATQHWSTHLNMRHPCHRWKMSFDLIQTKLVLFALA